MSRDAWGIALNLPPGNKQIRISWHLLVAS
jgi:hypothetical protein